MYTEEEAEEARQGGVDLLEEGLLLALSRSSIYQESLQILQQEGQAEIFPRGKPCAPVDPANSRPAQAVGAWGRPLHYQQGAGKRLLVPNRCSEAPSMQEGRLRQGDRAAMECKSPPKILQLMQYVPRYLLY